MRRIVIIVPDLLAFDALRQALPTLQTIAELGTAFKIAAPPQIETPEALWLGLGPNEAQLHQGPLTVAALGADPPDRSTHFHLTPMSFEDGVGSEIDFEISEEDQRQVFEQAKRLNTPKLTIVEGRDRDHGLVWEALGDLGTTAPGKVNNVADYLPEGDGEPLLRRFIDDSINLLSGLPLNEQRRDEGLPQINLLWPWGQGVRIPVPNIAIKRGERADVFSGSLRLAGRSRLAGYKHADRLTFGKGTNTRFEQLRDQLMIANVSITVIDAPSKLLHFERPEELNWIANEIDVKLLKPILEKALTSTTKISLLVPTKEVGIGLTYETGDQNANSIPFDERALDEKLLPTLDLSTAVQRGLS